MSIVYIYMFWATSLFHHGNYTMSKHECALKSLEAPILPYHTPQGDYKHVDHLTQKHLPYCILQGDWLHVQNQFCPLLENITMNTPKYFSLDFFTKPYLKIETIFQVKNTNSLINFYCNK